ncbi:putative fructokinase-7 [Cocos nucifera]|uniref:Putative fructokinase-7 n=1 Tax=Cocos nucifera TaxID=13894 RepID=A0A8K0N4W8_COCNU|nr:putative fructokinase-7 [Cocos nucifera]
MVISCCCSAGHHEHMELGDLIKVIEEEISFLTGGDPHDDDAVYKKLFHSNLKLFVVTEGQEGCRYYTKTFNGKAKGIKVKCVDTTGAGDAFMSGVLSILASNFDLYRVK